jgi:hypothetical protein
MRRLVPTLTVALALLVAALPTALVEAKSSTKPATR